MQALLHHVENFQLAIVIEHQKLAGGHMAKLKMMLKASIALYVGKLLKQEVNL